MRDSQSLTLTSNGGLLRALITEVKICETGTVSPNSPLDNVKTYRGIWDTGATNCVVTQKVVDDIGLKPIGVAKVNGVDGEHTSPVYLLDFILLNGVGIQGLRVTLGKLPDDTDALIGMDVISLGDFSITNLNDRTKMSFRIPSCIEADYVAEAQKGQYSRKQRREMDRQQKKQYKST